MYAVIRTGGKQYKVTQGDVIGIETIADKVGAKIKFDDVLVIGESGKPPIIGTPLVNGVSIPAEIIEQTRHSKIDVIKFKRRQNYRRQRGHRQNITKVKIGEITLKTSSKNPATKTKKTVQSGLKAKIKKPAKEKNIEKKGHSKAKPKTTS